MLLNSKFIYLKNLSKAIFLKFNQNLYLKLFTVGVVNYFSSSPYSLIFLLFFSFSYFLNEIEKDIYNYSYKKLYKSSFCFLSGYFVSQFYWFYEPLFSDLSVYWFLIPFAILLSVIILVPFYSLVILFYKFINLKLNIKNLILKIFLISFLLSFLEFARGEFLFNGFPWQVFGYFFSYPIFLQIFPKFLNIYLFSFICFIFVFNLYLFFKKELRFSEKIFKIFVTIIFILNLIYGTLTLIFAKNERFDVSVLGIQPNISAKMEIKINSYDYLKIFMESFSEVRPFIQNSIYIAPEAFIRFPLKEKNNLTKLIGSNLNSEQNLMITGGILFDEDLNKVYNVVYFINKNGALIGTYKKRNLVPFGEYIPFPFRQIIPKSILEPITGDTDFGTNAKDNHEAILYQNFPIIIPAICYDIIYTEQFFKILDKYKFQNRKHIIVNVTNDIWASGTISPYQHLRMSQWTAVRVRVPVVRVSNNGISAVIDKYGRILNQTMLNKKDILVSYF